MKAKRILAFLIAMIMMIGLVPAFAFADGDEKDGRVHHLKLVVIGGEHGIANTIPYEAPCDVPAGELVQVIVRPEAGYHAVVTVVDKNGDTVPWVNIAKYEFEMPALDTTITVTFAEGDPTYRLVLDIVNGEHGTASTNPAAPCEWLAGTPVDVIVRPEEGYRALVMVTDLEGNNTIPMLYRYHFDMPTCDTKVTVKFTEGTEPTYELALDVVGPGTANTNPVPGMYPEGTLVSVVDIHPTEPGGSYTIRVTDENGAQVPWVNTSRYEFAMPASKTTVTVTFEGGATTTYKLVLVTNGEEHGTAYTEPPAPCELTEGTRVNVHVEPDDGYRYTVKVTDAAGNEIALSERLSFSMPPSDTTVTVTYEAEPTVELPTFAGHSLLLTGQIGVQFFMNLPGGLEAWPNSYMTFEGNPRVVDSTTHFNVTVVQGQYAYMVNVSSIAMAEMLTPTFHFFLDETERTITGDPYSAEKYIKRHLNDTNQYGPLVRALADYGHYSQPYLSEHNHWTIGVEYAAFETLYTENFDYAAVTAALAPYAEESDITDFRTAVTFGAFTDLIMAFPYNGTDEVLLDGAPATLGTSGDYTTVTVARIFAADLLDTHTLRVGDKKATNVSPMSYAYKGMSSSNTKLKDLLCAFYNYGAACGAFGN